MNDKQLIRSCLQGEEEEFGKIVDKYKGKVVAMAINMLGNREDAEDTCQEVFIKAYRHLDRFDFERNFQSWLFGILYNHCLDQLRKKRRFRKFLTRMKRESVRPRSSPAWKVSSQLGSQVFNPNILNELSPKERATLFLWAHEGYTSEEVASVLRCSSSTARVHLYKARKKIKTILERENVSMQNG